MRWRPLQLALALGGGDLWGRVCVVSACLVLSFYSVVAGWARRYVWGALDGTLWGVMQSGREGFFTDKIAAGICLARPSALLCPTGHPAGPVTGFGRFLAGLPVQDDNGTRLGPLVAHALYIAHRASHFQPGEGIV
jgi:hypothetical protein